MENMPGQAFTVTLPVSGCVASWDRSFCAYGLGLFGMGQCWSCVLMLLNCQDGSYVAGTEEGWFVTAYQAPAPFLGARFPSHANSTNS
jgi:hypothetical protein